MRFGTGKARKKIGFFESRAVRALTPSLKIPQWRVVKKIVRIPRVPDGNGRQRGGGKIDLWRWGM